MSITLDRFQELGISGVTLAIGYPLLTPRFPDSAAYLDFYKGVASEVRRRGMVLAVEQIVIFVNSAFSSVTADFTGLTIESFIAQQHQMAQTMIDEVAPDYLTVLHEPDTYSVLTGLSELRDPDGAARYVEGVLNGLKRGSTKVGAGAVNYDNLSFFERFAETSVDYLDMHFYNVDPASIANAFEVAQIAKNHGLPLVLTEAWLYKCFPSATFGI